MTIELIDVKGLFPYKVKVSISHAAKADKTIYISGQIAMDPQGNLVGEGDVEKQAEYIWGNINKVLEAAGANFNDVVKIFQFVVGKENFAGMSKVRRKYLGRDPLPASTAIVVSGLAFPGLLLEVDVIAVTK